MDVAELFFEIDDPRQEGKCFHQLSDILMIVLWGYLADCEGFESDRRSEGLRLRL